MASIRQASLALKTAEDSNMTSQRNHIMIDIEALDVRPTAAIAAIGAVAFNPETGDVTDKLYCRVDIESSEQSGGTLGASTVKWWLRQSADVRAELICEEAVTVERALADLNLFVLRKGSFGDCIVWSKGTDYDFPILYSAMARAGIAPAWKYHQVRDVRTLLETLPLIGADSARAVPFEGAPHQALNDALHQARLVTFVWRGLAAMGTVHNNTMMERA
ncbi:3'-5' exoribonuclease [Pantoea sp. Bo_2]|uniref:3'-5' exonuclease n=1 Tax=unclassified Pantoea TaxID=2630326 RepID=UPI0012320B1F|nr:MULTISPECIES: 3'-5' exonuclease [unclassified Pantoea]KAA5938669.1 3'-5' exoribonuclease [Pantoea sp. VH_3]KAA5946843.1 3'-5' exoribonuclease [Pantoea sp. VH_25]KAA5977636.1 3'-5' exoribonuclease [Pantoea sp. M_3]KAA6041323.1 3'-5' exoribonuclease [Pantoea sp. FN_2b]KAA6045679.1 3'-5' exoribonuclease [Pantoea sp. Bo_5]